MPGHLRPFLAAALLLSLPVTAHAAGDDKLADPPVTLRIGYLKGTTDLTLAKAHESLERALGPRGVSISWKGPFPASAPAVEALNAGAVDLTGGSSTSYIASRAAGVKLVMFAYQPQSAGNEGIVVRRDSPLHDATSLQGHSVAVNRGGTGEYLLLRALTKANLPAESVTRDYLAPPDAASALSGGHVDAWATWDPYLSVVVQNGSARVLVDGVQAGSENAIAFFVSQDFLRAHRPVVAAVFDVLRAENTWGRAHKQEAGEIWARELGLPADVAGRLGEFNANPLGPVGTTEAEHIDHVADWYVANHVIPRKPEITPFLTDITQ